MTLVFYISENSQEFKSSEFYVRRLLGDVFNDILSATLSKVDKVRKIAYGVSVKWCWEGKEEVPKKNLYQCYIFHHKRFYQPAVVLEIQGAADK